MGGNVSLSTLFCFFKRYNVFAAGEADQQSSPCLACVNMISTTAKARIYKEIKKSSVILHGITESFQQEQKLGL